MLRKTLAFEKDSNPQALLSRDPAHTCTLEMLQAEWEQNFSTLTPAMPRFTMGPFLTLAETMQGGSVVRPVGQEHRP